MTPAQAHAIAVERLERLHDADLRARADAAREAMYECGETTELAWLTLGYVNEALQKGEPDLATAELDAAFAMVSADTDESLWLGMLTLRGIVCAIQSDTAGQIRAYTALRQAADRCESAEYQLAARGSLALVGIRCGVDCDDALVEALQFLPRVAAPVAEECGLRTIRLYNALERDVEADVRADELLSFLQTHRVLPDRARALAHLWLAAWLVHDKRPIKALELATPLLRHQGMRMGQEPALLRKITSEAHFQLGEYSRARSLAAEGLASCPSDRFYSAERGLHQLLSRIAEAEGDIASALVHQRRAFAVSRAHEQHHLTNTAHALFRELHARDGHHEVVGLEVRNESLAAVNEALEREVARHRQTRAALEHAQDHLIRSAHAAGMSQVASDVLHTLGNALNGLGVATQLIEERLRDDIGSAATHELLADRLHENASHEQIVRYLELTNERSRMRDATLLDDVLDIRKGVERIGAIVQAQKLAVGARSVDQSRPVRDLTDQLMLQSRRRTGGRTVRLCPVPDVTVCTDLQLLLTTLDALVANAVEAIAEVPPPRQWVEIRVWEDADDVVFSVSDGGDGVADGMRDRLFQHGATDKPGHDGFGLHAAALAARVLHGTLTLWPPSPDRGACFLLRIRRHRPATVHPIAHEASNRAEG